MFTNQSITQTGTDHYDSIDSLPAYRKESTTYTLPSTDFIYETRAVFLVMFQIPKLSSLQGRNLIFTEIKPP